MPRFKRDSIDGFNALDYDLFPVHTNFDRNGFVCINLDVKRTPEISWDSQYGHVDLQEVLVPSGVDWDSVELDLTWTKDGQFTWKLMQDNYNEVS